MSLRREDAVVFFRGPLASRRDQMNVDEDVRVVLGHKGGVDSLRTVTAACIRGAAAGFGQKNIT